MTQAARDARHIQKQFGRLIESACAESVLVPPALIAALVSVECQRTKDGGFDPRRARFEAHVFAALKAVRAGAKRSYNKITQRDIKDASTPALAALSKSYGATQIMGWSVIKMIPSSIADLRDESKHFALAVARLEICAKQYLERKDYACVLRIWNTGKAKGKTHSPTYVARALAVFDIYARLAPLPKQAGAMSPAQLSPGQFLSAPTRQDTHQLMPSRSRVRAALVGVCAAIGSSYVLPASLGLVALCIVALAVTYCVARQPLLTLNLKG